MLWNISLLIFILIEFHLLLCYEFLMLLPPPVLQWFQPSCQAKVTQLQFHVLIDEEVTWQTNKFQ